MSKRTKILSVLAITALSAMAIIYIKRDAVQMWVFEKAAEKAITRDIAATLDPKQLHVAFCGTGSPMPSRERPGACSAVLAGGKLFIFDTGEGSGGTLSLMGMPLNKVEGVWLTHLHSDHFEGLGPLALQRWAGTSAATPLPVFGPEGIDQVTQGLTQAYRIDSTYRVAHHGEAVVPPSGFGFAGNPIDVGVVYDRGGVRITAFAVDHEPITPAFGYRLDYNDLSVTISGDTANTPALARAAKGSNLMVSELLSPRMVGVLEHQARRAGQINRAKIFADIQDYHIAPEDSAKAAQVAGTGMLAFTHIVPAVPSMLETALIGDAAEHYDGKIRVMRDGDLVSISGRGKFTARNLLQ